MYVIQIVGYKNSGKTTFINQWIKTLTAKGLQTATIKHHGHGGDPDILTKKDSYKHYRAGASITTVIGENQLLMTAEKDKLPLDKLLNLYQLLGTDYVFVEGFKQWPLPKIVLIRDDREDVMHQLENVQLVSRGQIEEAMKMVETNLKLFEWHIESGR
ncbi:molybdopterin-guanine dinucleotide biosynthesis protein B [Gracilibacillus caseinilyticus]|uniref:Molybdopterin-guanine dinucleotide biosynthesis protein B n=1 Tax=Gracilibacillus caseinilyticus TaxID=2932256 RepID=A0ABY4EWB0_9BACI|nr:molybdopterin-guanine dinucleotide biosynthesis protein B [Gracilibacillus caseinilyticus]UOQ48153.1 molybdopterin-guanine dinucleotide biosynthesis protein B [Gracilibacillus caseinilyticus]